MFGGRCSFWQMEKLRLIGCYLPRDLVPAIERGPPPLPKSHPGQPHISMSSQERARSGSRERGLSLPFIFLSLLSTRPQPPRRVSGGGRPPLPAGRTVPPVTPGTLPAPLPPALPSWTRGLWFASLTSPLPSPRPPGPSAPCPLFLQPADHTLPSTPDTSWMLLVPAALHSPPDPASHTLTGV